MQGGKVKNIVSRFDESVKIAEEKRVAFEAEPENPDKGQEYYGALIALRLAAHNVASTATNKMEIVDRRIFKREDGA